MGLSVIGILVAESFSPLFGGECGVGPAIEHLTEVRKVQPEFFELLAVVIGVVETSRAQNGWVPPAQVEGKQFLNDDYYPGDINFDPLGLKPTDPAEFAEMQTTRESSSTSATERRRVCSWDLAGQHSA